MIQLILDVDGDAISMPESRNGGYTIKEETLSESIQMISGRTVREYRGKVWVITHQYGYMSESDMNKFISACEKGMKQSITCSFLVHGSSELKTSKFIVSTYNRPKFMWSRMEAGDGTEPAIPLWADYSVTLREVKPHA